MSLTTKPVLERSHGSNSSGKRSDTHAHRSRSQKRPSEMLQRWAFENQRGNLTYTEYIYSAAATSDQDEQKKGFNSKH